MLNLLRLDGWEILFDDGCLVALVSYMISENIPFESILRIQFRRCKVYGCEPVMYSYPRARFEQCSLGSF
jgi:hypothetical protein